jgi:radical SAM protein with 4Fe4S-binding SPASM domain
MQKVSVKDFVISQIAALSPLNGCTDAIDFTKTIGEHKIAAPALLKRVEGRYGVSLGEEKAFDLHTLTVDEFIHYVIKKLAKSASNQTDSKKVFENFVFSGRCTKLTSPYEINIDLTFRCNLRCIFCYASSATIEEQQKELTTDEVLDLIDEFKALNGAFVLFGGGEPFLREDFLEIFKYTKSKGLWTYVITNGSLITEEVAYEYAKYYNPLFDKIQVSLDGATPEINDRQRGIAGAFEHTLDGIKNLVATGKIKPIINTVVTQINYDDIPNILNCAIEHNALTYRCLKLHKIGRGGVAQLYEKLALTQAQSDALFDFLNRRREELFGVIGIASDNACVFPMSVKAIRDQFQKRPGVVPASYSCAAGTTKLAIAPDGGVVPCSYFYDFPEFSIGSLKKKSLKELWEEDAVWKDFREPLKVEGKCTSCSYLYACKTGCRIMAYVGCGSLGGPDMGCSYNPVDDSD